jgi:hypothetical protein
MPYSYAFGIIVLRRVQRDYTWSPGFNTAENAPELDLVDTQAR